MSANVAAARVAAARGGPSPLTRGVRAVVRHGGACVRFGGLRRVLVAHHHGEPRPPHGTPHRPVGPHRTLRPRERRLLLQKLFPLPPRPIFRLSSLAPHAGPAPYGGPGIYIFFLQQTNIVTKLFTEYTQARNHLDHASFRHGAMHAWRSPSSLPPPSPRPQFRYVIPVPTAAPAALVQAYRLHPALAFHGQTATATHASNEYAMCTIYTATHASYEACSGTLYSATHASSIPALPAHS